MPDSQTLLRHPAWLLFYALALIAASVMLVSLHWAIVNAPVALDYYEGVTPSVTGIYAEGGNPYTGEHVPQHVSLYGMLYHKLMAPLTLWFGNSLEIHRQANAVLLLLSTALIGFAAHKNGATRLHAVAAAVIAYAGFLFYSTPVAAPNALGITLMLGTILVPWYGGFRHGPLLVSAALAILGLYTKVYFVFGAVAVGLYLGLAVSVARGAYYATVLAVLMVSSAFLTVQGSPYYFDTVYFAATNSDGILLTADQLNRQLIKFAELYAGPLALCVVAAIVTLRSVKLRWPSSRHWAWQSPLLLQRPRYFWVCFLAGLAVICISLGHNPGNWMSYLFQLMSPFFIIAAAASISKARIWPALSVPLVLLSLWSIWNFLPKNFEIDLAGWDKLEQVIIEEDQILASQAVLMPLVKHGKEVFQNGHTVYFHFASGKPEWLKHENEYDQVEQVWQRYIDTLYKRVEAQEFDIALFHPWDVQGVFRLSPPQSPNESGVEFFHRHYRQHEQLTLDLGGMPGGGIKKIGVWRPRSTPLSLEEIREINKRNKQIRAKKRKA